MGTTRYRAHARTPDQGIGYWRLLLVCAMTAGLIGLGVGIATLDPPLAGRHCSVPNVTTHDATGLTLSCGPASTGSDASVWQYVPAL